MGGLLRAAAGQLLEQLDVGVAKAVDGLLGIADREQVLARDRVDQPELHTVGVLELVDHDAGKPAAVALAQVIVGGEQTRGEQLEVLEVHSRVRALGRGVVGRVAPQEHVEQAVGASGPPVGADRANLGQGIGVGLADGRAQRGTVSPRQRELIQRSRPQLSGARDLGASAQALERLEDTHTRLVHQREFGADGLGRPGERRQRRAQWWRRSQRRQRRLELPARAQLSMDPQNGRAQRLGPVRGDEVNRLRASGGQLLERGFKGGGGQPPGLVLVEHHEAGVKAGVERMGPQHAGTEAVNGGDEGGFGRRGSLVLPELAQAGSDAVAHLRRRLLGERDGQDLGHADAIPQHRGDEALD